VTTSNDLTDTDCQAAIGRVMHLADELETEAFADVQPWMIARLIRVAVFDSLKAALTEATRR
jgi:hypothetical protein